MILGRSRLIRTLKLAVLSFLMEELLSVVKKKAVKKMLKNVLDEERGKKTESLERLLEKERITVAYTQ